MVMPTKTNSFSILVFVLFAGSLISSLLFKENRLWMDEILSYLLISDPSLTHLNEAIVSALDANPPLFANLYWLAAHVLSLNILFLKAVSISLFAVTLAILYRYTTYLIGTPVTNFCLISALAAFSFLNVTLAIQIRSYPLFLCIGMAYFVVVHQLTRQPTSGRLLMAHLSIGLLLAFTHNFGLFYLAAGGAFIGLLGIWAKDWRYGYALATFGLIGLFWLLVWYPSFAIQAKAGVPHSWIPLPTWRSFFRVTGELMPTPSHKLEGLAGDLPLLAILRTLGEIALFGYIALPGIKRGFKASLNDPAFMLYLLAGFVQIFTIVLALTVSLVYTSIFISRYLWPTHLLIIYQLVYAFYYVIDPQRRGSFVRLGSKVSWLLPVYVFTLGFFLFYQNLKTVLAPTIILTDVQKLDKRYPVFLESSLFFIPVWYYDRDHSIYFLLDHPSAFAIGNDPGTTVGFYTLSSLREKYNVGAVIPLNKFNRTYIPHFFVVDERWNYQIERFIQNKSVAVVRVIPTAINGVRILECIFRSSPTEGLKATNH